MKDNSEQVENLKRELVAEYDNLEKYKSDYTKLVNQEEVLASITVICNDTAFKNACLYSSINNIHDKVDVEDVEVDGIDELVSFHEYQYAGGFIWEMDDAIEEMVSNIKDVCTEIDKKKEEIAHNIQDTNDKITSIKSKIAKFS